MANIGADVGRTITAWRKGQAERFEGALDRALDLFAASVEQLAAEHSPRLKEVCRAREEFLGLFYAEDFDQQAAAIEAYFVQFATAARPQ
jgi:hypothetical protein